MCGLSEADIAAGKLNEEHRQPNVILKGSYFPSTDSSGSHNIVGGFDAFEDSRQNDNYQSGSGFRSGEQHIIRGENLYRWWSRDYEHAGVRSLHPLEPAWSRGARAARCGPTPRS